MHSRKLFFISLVVSLGFPTLLLISGFLMVLVFSCVFDWAVRVVLWQLFFYALALFDFIVWIVIVF